MDESISRGRNLKNWPVFPSKGGKIIPVLGAGTEYQVKDDVFPATKTMSGSILELEPGAIREIHWHPNSEEHHYVLKGKIRATVYGVDQTSKDALINTYDLNEGDLGVVPTNYIHALENMDKDEHAKLVITFNTPS